MDGRHTLNCKECKTMEIKGFFQLRSVGEGGAKSFNKIETSSYILHVFNQKQFGNGKT